MSMLAAAATDPLPYVIHAGDQLAITVFGEDTLTKAVTVAPDGTIAYPLIGKFSVGGRTVSDASSRLTSALRPYVRNPEVTIAVTSEGPDNVLVLGDVKTPGKYSLPGTSRLMDAIAAAGGLGSTNGDYPTARVVLGNAPMVDVPLDKLLRQGDVSLNMLLAPDAVVYVKGPTPILVQVLGAVDKPGNVEVAEGDRLSMAIAKAGNSSNALADLSNIHVTRVMEDGRTTTSTYDLYHALKSGDLSVDPLLHKGDVVYVPQAKKTDHTGTWQTLLLLLGRL